MSDQLRAAVIGMGPRGCGLLQTIHAVDQLDIVAICEIIPERLENGRKKLEELNIKAKCYDDYRLIIDQGGIDCVFVVTNWINHWEICVDFMRAGIYTATEVNGAASLEECWQLVRTYEQTGIPVMMLENCCYGRNELMVMNMARKGALGELVYAECGYCHDLREMLLDASFHRLDSNRARNGDLYPTHGIGPMAKLFDINRGNRFLTLTSFSTKSKGLHDYARRNVPEHPVLGMDINCGDVTTSLIKCANGEVIMLRHSIMLPQPYTRAGLVHGTRGIYREDKGPKGAVNLDGVHEHGHWEPLENLRAEHEHPIWKDYEANPKDGHGGMDFLVIDAFCDAVKNRTQTPIDVYDTATYMAVTVLSEQSVALGGMPQAFPDFTSGKWTTSRPVFGGKYSLDQERATR